MSKKKIFLTGGTGLVGSALTTLFSSNALDITASYRNRKSNEKNISWIKADLLDPYVDLHTCLANVDVIVHNAASIKAGKTQAELDELKLVNVDFTRKLLDAASSFGIKKVIFTSSFSLIGRPLPDVIREDALIEIKTPYAESKYIGEQLVQEYSAKYNVDYNICRISSPVSTDLSQMPDNVVRKWIDQSSRMENVNIFGKGSRSQDFVSVTDIANVYLSCIENMNTSGIFNVGSGNTISMLELAEVITSYFGNNFQCVSEDENENDRWNISIEKARQELNYKPNYTSSTIIKALLKNTRA